MKPSSNSLSLSSSCLFLFLINSVREEGGEADLAGESNKERAPELVEEAFTTLEDEFELVARIDRMLFWGWRWEYIGLTF